jgi:serine/threonine-protein kinase
LLVDGREETYPRWLNMSGPPASTTAQLPRPGDIVGGKYVIDSLIGQGGMGAVFRGKHRVTGGVRAIKVMLADASNPEARQRFMNEARAAAEIQNEHVVRVDDVDEELGYAFMVLELLDGEDLAQILEKRRGPLEPHLAVGYVLQALRGVAQAHALGIVHRDLKPSNLFLAKRSDGSQVVKVLDFGISKASSAGALAQGPSALTSTKAMLGSPLYMSPEQLRSSKSVDARADIWATGIILFELITNSLPFMGENLGELFAAILENDAPLLSQRVSGIPQGLDAVVARCLRRRPEERFQSAQELIQALAPFAQPGAGTSPYAMSAYAPSTANPPFPGAAITPSFQNTPNGPPQPPRPGAITGNGSAPRAMPGPAQGTVALGAVTPQPGPQPGPHGAGMIGAQTNSAWQSEPAVPKSNMPLIFGVLGALAVVGLIGGGIALSRAKSTTVDPTTANPPPVASSAPVPPPVPTETAATTVTTATATATPSAPSATAAVQTAAVHTTTAPTTRPTGHATVATKVDPPPPATPTPKPTGGTGVNTR